MQNKLFSDFDYQIVDDVVVIYDLDKIRKKVTNDIANVIAQIKAEIPDLGSRKIIYSDSMKIFDGINVNKNGDFVGYYSINELRLRDAIEKIKNNISDKNVKS